MITAEYIQDRYEAILQEVSGIIPVEKWAVKPAGLDFTTEKTKYGLATPDGIVLINKVFIGTNATTKLDFVLRHEFAHHAIGLHHHHNKKFKRIESLFGVDHSIDVESELKEIENKIEFKYTVYAYLENGETINVGGAHRKTKKYTAYLRTERSYLSIKGIPVNSFEFVDNAV